MRFTWTTLALAALALTGCEEPEQTGPIGTAGEETTVFGQEGMEQGEETIAQGEETMTGAATVPTQASAQLLGTQEVSMEGPTPTGDEMQEQPQQGTYKQLHGTAQLDLSGDQVQLTGQLEDLEPGSLTVAVHEHGDCSGEGAGNIGNAWTIPGTTGQQPGVIATLNVDQQGSVSLDEQLDVQGQQIGQQLIGRSLVVYHQASTGGEMGMQGQGMQGQGMQGQGMQGQDMQAEPMQEEGMMAEEGQMAEEGLQEEPGLEEQDQMQATAPTGDMGEPIACGVIGLAQSGEVASR